MGFWEFKPGFWVLLTIVVGFEPFDNLGRCIRCRFPRSSCQTPRKRLLRRFRSCCLFCFSLRRIQLFLLSAFTRLTVRSALVGGRHGFESRLGRSFLAISLSLALSLSLSLAILYMGSTLPKLAGELLYLYTRCYLVGYAEIQHSGHFTLRRFTGTEDACLMGTTL